MDFSVSVYTKELLERRTDDLRVDFLYDVLFGDRIRSLMKENAFETPLRPAKVGDKVTYLVINDAPTLKATLEQNIANINRLIKDRNSLPVRNAWIVVFTYDDSEKEADIKTDVYCNPNASDCKLILENPKNIVATIIAVEYDTVDTAKANRNKKEGEVVEPAIVNYLLLAPLFQSNANEYEVTMRDLEAENLKTVFWIDFSKPRVPKTERPDAPSFEKS